MVNIGWDGVAGAGTAAEGQYLDAVSDGSVRSLIDANDKTLSWLNGADTWSTWSTFTEEMKTTLSVKPVFAKALVAFRDGRIGEKLLDDPGGHLLSAGRKAFSFSSPEIDSAVSEATEAATKMPAAQGVAALLTDRVDTYYKLFRFTQIAGVGTDGVSKLDSALNAGHVPLPGYDNIKHWPGPAGG